MLSEGYSCRSVCLFVYDYSRSTGYEAAYEQYIPTASVLQRLEKECGDFAETTAFERYGVNICKKTKPICIMIIWLTSTRFSSFSEP